MESSETYWDDLALLEWHLELGAVDAIQDAPVDRYALAAQAPKPAPEKPATAPEAPQPHVTPGIDPVAVAKEMADAAGDIAGLKAALNAFPHCALQKGARGLVFASGAPGAHVMILSDTPNRAEDRAGAPFVGEEGVLLDKMLAAIGLARTSKAPATAVYCAAPVPWRTPHDAPLSPKDAAMLTPFLQRHIALVKPRVCIVMGHAGLQMLGGQGGLTKRRGLWSEIAGCATLPMFPPSHLIKTPLAKREAWADLLSLQAKLKDMA
jgi:DNA polymerase